MRVKISINMGLESKLCYSVLSVGNHFEIPITQPPGNSLPLGDTREHWPKVPIAVYFPSYEPFLNPTFLEILFKVLIPRVISKQHVS